MRIIVRENYPPKKLSGLTSFSVKFDYNAEIIEFIKTLVPAVYDKKTQEWEVSSTYLSKLLDTLTYYGDIELKLAQPEIREISETKPLSEIEEVSFRENPYRHQIEAINYGLQHRKFLLLDGCGLGKTNEIIWLAETLKRRGLLDHCLIICGVNSLKLNWESEIRKFSTETCRVIGKRITRTGTVRYRSVAERAEELKNPIEEFFVITNIETLRDDKVIEAISKSKNSFGMIAVDEAHKCLTGDMTICTEAGNILISTLKSSGDGLPKVLSYNPRTKTNEFKEIEAVSVSNPTEPVVELVLLEQDKEYVLKCTESHRVFTTNRGWVKAKDLTENDDIKIS